MYSFSYALQKLYINDSNKIRPDLIEKLLDILKFMMKIGYTFTESVSQ